MPALVQTRANVGIDSLVQAVPVIVGEAVLQGQPGYRLANTQTFYRASKATKAAAEAIGFFMSPASTGGKSLFVFGDGLLINLGATLTVGVTYAVGVAGDIIPADELASGDWKTLLGEAKTTSILQTKFNPTRLQLP